MLRPTVSHPRAPSLLFPTDHPMSPPGRSERFRARSNLDRYVCISGLGWQERPLGGIRNIPGMHSRLSHSEHSGFLYHTSVTTPLLPYVTVAEMRSRSLSIAGYLMLVSLYVRSPTVCECVWRSPGACVLYILSNPFRVSNPLPLCIPTAVNSV